MIMNNNYYYCAQIRHLLYLEKSLKYNDDGKGFFVGDKVFLVISIMCCVGQ